MRRIYKRDKDGQFAKVNTLINKVESMVKTGAAARPRKRVLSPSEKSRLKGGKRVGKGGSAAGRLSLAMDPAKQIARNHDLSGDNRSEANKAAYREAGKLARELKLKHGDRAPTADKIYSTAKKMQLGLYTNKAGQRPAKLWPDGKKAVGTPKPLPPKPSAGSVKKPVAKLQWNNRNTGYTGHWKSNDGNYEIKQQFEPKLPGRKSAKPIGWELTYKGESLGMAESFADAKKYADAHNQDPAVFKMPQAPKKPDTPKPKTLKLVKIDELEGLNTKDLIDQYNLADQSDRPRIRDRAMMWLKSRANSGDQEAKDFLQKDPNGPKLPAVSIHELHKRISRAVKMLKSSSTTEEKKLYQDRIDNLNADIKNRLASATPEELRKDLKEAQRELVSNGRDVKVFKNRAKQYPDNSTYKTLAADAERSYQVSKGAVALIKGRLDELSGKVKPAAPEQDYKKMSKTDVTDPPAPRLIREREVRSMFDSWFSTYRYKLEKSSGNEPWAQRSLTTDWDQKFRTDEAFRKDILAKFGALLADPTPLDNPEESWTYRDFTERYGYHDTNAKQRAAMAKADVKLLEEYVNKDVQAARLENAFTDWLENSESANDLATNYDYGTDDLFEIFMDGNEDFPWRSNLINMYEISDNFRKKFRNNTFDGSALAKQPRPPAPPKPDEVEPVPYRAKSNSLGELRRERESREKELSFGMTKIFGNASFSQLTPEQQDAERKRFRGYMDELTKLSDKIAKAKPDRKRSLSSAKTFDDLFNIFSERNPKISASGWHEPDGHLAKDMERAGIYTPAQKAVVLDRCIRMFEAAEAMHDMYPDVPFDGFNSRNEKSFKNGLAIAHCSRGLWINIECNNKYLVDQTPAPASSKGFHPPSEDPYKANVTHEFGHSIDWYAFGMWDLANDKSLLDRNEGKGIPRGQIWAAALVEVVDDRDVLLRKAMADAYAEYKKDHPQSTMDYNEFYNKNTCTYQRENMHELIAESWQDCYDNGGNATPISKAINRLVLERYHKRVKNGKGPLHEIKSTP